MSSLRAAHDSRGGKKVTVGGEQTRPRPPITQLGSVGRDLPAHPNSSSCSGWPCRVSQACGRRRHVHSAQPTATDSLQLWSQTSLAQFKASQSLQGCVIMETTAAQSPTSWLPDPSSLCGLVGPYTLGLNFLICKMGTQEPLPACPRGWYLGQCRVPGAEPARQGPARGARCGPRRRIANRERER